MYKSSSMIDRNVLSMFDTVYRYNDTINFDPDISKFSLRSLR